MPALEARATYALVRVVASPLFAHSVLMLVLIFEFSVLFLGASRRSFWYDELLTSHVSSFQPFSRFWSAIKAGVDGMPIGYYLIVRAARMLPGDLAVTLRLPSILGYLMTLLGVYWFAGKRLPALAGLAGVFLITLSPFRDYALEARSYSLLVGFLAISAVLWQRIGEKRFMTPSFALFLTLAVSSHHLAVVALSAFAVAELVGTLLARRIRWGVWCACLVATVPFFVSLPILLDYRDNFGKTFWSPSSLGMAVSTYGSYLGIGSILALVLIAFFGIVVADALLRASRPTRQGSIEEFDFSLSETVLVAGFLYFPAFLVVLTKLLHSGYTNRYGWPAILGLALGSVFLVRNIWLQSQGAFLLVALMIGFVYQSGNSITKLFKAGSSAVDGRWTSLAEFSRHEPGLPVVIGSPTDYLEANEYSPPELRDQLIEVADGDNAARLSGSDTTEKTNRLLARFIPLNIVNLAEFQAAHQRFLVRSGGSFDWFTKYLVENRYDLRLLSQDGGTSFYVVQRQIQKEMTR